MLYSFSMGFIKFILIVVLVLLVLRLVLRLLLPFILVKAAKSFEDKFKQQYQQQANQYRKPEGTIEIKDPPSSKKQNSKDLDGDYVDFEEIK